MVSFLPNAHGLRRDLKHMSAQRQITWVDVTAPGDGCTFALCDPVGCHRRRPAGSKMAPGAVSRLQPDLVCRKMAKLKAAIFPAAFPIYLRI